MKKVFFINSHTTFLTAQGTINYLGLNKESIIFLYVRNYKNSLFKVSYKTIDASELYEECEFLFKNYFVRKRIIADIDKFIKNYINDEYELFAPHLGNGLYQLFYTNPNCKKLSYIQEGGIPFKSAYKTSLTPLEYLIITIYNKHLLTKRVWKPFRWYVKGYMKDNSVIDSYATSDSFFKYLPSINHIIKWPYCKLDITIKKESCIFIFDGFSHHQFIEQDFYLKMCERLIQETKKEYNYIRFHPVQDTDERNKILNIFKRFNADFEIMDESIPFELIISSVQNLTIAGFGSSLLFFARDFGHNVICKDKWLISSKKYRIYRKKSGFDWF